ncbi:MAG: acetyltransferase, partial [bacterium]
MHHEFNRYPTSEVVNSRYILDEKPTIQEGAVIVDSKLGNWTEIGRNSRIIESEIGDYSYDDGHVSITYSVIGKFCSIASYVRINPGNHPFQRVTQHHMTYRLKKFKLAEEDDHTFFDWRRAH